MDLELVGSLLLQGNWTILVREEESFQLRNFTLQHGHLILVEDNKSINQQIQASIPKETKGKIATEIKKIQYAVDE